MSDLPPATVTEGSSDSDDDSDHDNATEDQGEKFAQQFAQSIHLDGAFNSGNGKLPFGYYNPETEGKVYWVCSTDKGGKITSVFAFQGDTTEESDRKISYLKDMAEARWHRDELVKAGWKPLETPEMKFHYKGKEVKMDRKQKRKLQKRMKALAKKNPAMKEEMDRARREGPNRDPPSGAV